MTSDEELGDQLLSRIFGRKTMSDNTHVERLEKDVEHLTQRIENKDAAIRSAMDLIEQAKDSRDAQNVHFDLLCLQLERSQRQLRIVSTRLGAARKSLKRLRKEVGDLKGPRVFTVKAVQEPTDWKLDPFRPGHLIHVDDLEAAQRKEEE